MRITDGVIIEDGMLLRAREVTALRKSGKTIEIREITSDDPEYSRLLRTRIANAAKQLALAEGECAIRRAFVQHQALVKVFDMYAGYGGELDHEIRREGDYRGTRPRYFILVSHG
jgi:hypothetical protein